MAFGLLPKSAVSEHANAPGGLNLCSEAGPIPKRHPSGLRQLGFRGYGKSQLIRRLADSVQPCAKIYVVCGQPKREARKAQSA